MYIIVLRCRRRGPPAAPVEAYNISLKYIIIIIILNYIYVK